jgi:hypothetical protein
MRLSSSLLALLGLVSASQAQAGLFLKLDIIADVTNTYNVTPNPAVDPVSNHLGWQRLTMEGLAPDQIDFTSGAYLQRKCEKCLETTIFGNTLQVAVDPFFVQTYGGTWFTLVFDHDLNGDLRSASSDSFVSGQFSSFASGGPMFNNFAGPIMSVDLSVVDTVPEPESWAMLVVGFAGIGSALRRRRRGDMHAH